MRLEIESASTALGWLTNKPVTVAIIVSDFKPILRGYMVDDCANLQGLILIYCPGQ